MRNLQFVNEEYYHVYNRGVDRRKTFFDRADYERFIKGLYVFRELQYLGNIPRQPLEEIIQRQVDKPLVQIVAFCLMPNHC